MLSILVLHLVFCAPSNTATDINDLRWLEGTWSENSQTGFRESWQWQNDQLITGFGFTTEDGDTLASEKLQIFVKDTNIFYQAVVFGQNQDQGVRFKLTYKSADSLVFQNPGHDFPKYIIYSKLSDEVMHVYVRDGFGENSKGFGLKLLRQ